MLNFTETNIGLEIEGSEEELDTLMGTSVRHLAKELQKIPHGQFQEKLEFFTDELRQYLIEYLVQVTLTDIVRNNNAEAT